MFNSIAAIIPVAALGRLAVRWAYQTAIIVTYALYATGCAHGPLGRTASTDVNCGVVDGVSVRLREGLQTWPATMSCPEARIEVASALGATPLSALVLNTGWTVIFTGGNPGMAIGRDMTVYMPDGMTYPSTRIIVVRALHPWILAHEFGHALDVDAGRPNVRDRL